MHNSDDSNGRISLVCDQPVATIIQRIRQLLDKQGVNVFAVVDHSAAADRVGLELGDTQVILFGNPTVGTLLMQDLRPIALELPLKLLVYNQGDTTRIQYRLLSSQHNIYGFDQNKEIIQKLDRFITNLAQSAANSSPSQQ